MRAGDAGALALVHHPDGAALAADRAMVGAGPLDVTYQVVAVAPVPGRPGDAHVELRTTSAGTTTTEAVVLELDSTPAGWRVRRVTS